MGGRVQSARDRNGRNLVNGIRSPSVTLNPVGQIVNAGANITLTITAVRATAYQWRKDGINIPGANTASYTITDFRSADEGAYSVEVSNAGGKSFSAEAILTMPLTLVIDTHPSDPIWRFPIPIYPPRTCE